MTAIEATNRGVADAEWAMLTSTPDIPVVEIADVERRMSATLLLGFVVVLARFVRIPGSFLLAATFLLELQGVDRERALAMALIVQVSAIVSVTGVAAVALTWFGAELRELKATFGAS